MFKEIVIKNENSLFIKPVLWTYRYIRYYVFKKIKFLWFHTPFFLPLYCQTKMNALKNTKSGRCFIVGTGPSLTLEDLQKLQNETLFCANSFCTIAEKKLIMQKNTASRNPWYYGFQDAEVYEKYGSIIV